MKRLTFDEVPRLQTGGLLNIGAVFDIRPGRRKQYCKLSARVVNSRGEAAIVHTLVQREAAIPAGARSV